MTASASILLLVEDDPGDARLALAALQELALGKDVIVVTDGAQALDYLHRRNRYLGRPPGNPAVVLLDLKLPKIGGLEVLREIKTDQALRLMPVVVLTSSRETTDLRQAYELGANGYVVKTIDFKAFRNALRVCGEFWTIANEPPPGGHSVNASGSRTVRTGIAPPCPDPATRPAVRILHLEDDPHDARLVHDTLAAGGVIAEITVLESRADFLKALKGEPFDLILADVNLPAFDGQDALAVARVQVPQVPFIFVSGVLGEERAIDTLKNGATDYVLKERLSRLVPAVRRALEEAETRAARQRSERALRQRESLLSNVLSACQDAIVVTDNAGKCIEANLAAERIFGLGREELATGNLGTHLPQDLGAKGDFARFVQEGRGHWEHPVRRPDGSIIEVETDSVANVLPGWHLSVVRDVTEKRQAQRALVRGNKDLELRVEARTAELSQTVTSLHVRSRQLQALASELTLAEHRMRQRLAHVLHDGLQQTLVGAKLRLEQLERGEDPDVSAKAAAITELIDDSIRTSRSLTTELSPPVLYNTGLVPALRWLAGSFLDKHGLQVAFEGPEDGDLVSEDLTILLFHALRELLFNVVKHAQCTTAALRIQPLGDIVQIVLEDQGLGFDPKVLLRQPTAKQGLGLCSIRERLDYLGGHLVVESAPGQGSRFTLTVPRLEGGQARVRTGDPRSRPAAADIESLAAHSVDDLLRVMIVDDHLIVRQGVAMLIREVPDLEIVGEASNGELAVQLARELRPDVILMDITMPVMNGIEATRLIHAELPEIGIIGLSMFEEAEQASAMHEAGAAAYLSKSAPSAGLIETIRAVASVKPRVQSPRLIPLPEPAAECGFGESGSREQVAPAAE